MYARVIPFVVAVLLGLVLIITLRLIFSNDPFLGSILAALASVIAIVGLFLYYGWKQNDIAKDDPSGIDRAGDELYYLGLFYTLVSLVMGLLFVYFAIKHGDSAARESIYDLVGSFGIALISTIAGIILRIVFQTMFQQLDTKIDALGIPHQDITKATLEFRNQLQISLIHIQQFNRQVTNTQEALTNRVSQLVDEASKQIPDIAEATIKETVNRLESAAQTSAGQLAEHLSKVNASVTESLSASSADAINKVKDVSLQAVNHTHESSRRLIDGVDRNFSEQHSEISNMANEIKESAEKFMTLIENTIETTSGTARRSLDEIKANTEKLKETINNLFEGMHASGNPLTTLDENLKKASQQTLEISSSLEGAKLSISGLVERIVVEDQNVVQFGGEFESIKLKLNAIDDSTEELKNVIARAGIRIEKSAHKFENQSQPNSRLDLIKAIFTGTKRK